LKKIVLSDLDIDNQYLWKSTAEIRSYKGSVEQGALKERFIEGLELKARNYNIFVSGESGTGRRSFVRQWIEEFALTEKTPEDWVYVYNFEDMWEPVAIPLPNGIGRAIKKDWEATIEEVLKSLEGLFESESYQKKASEVSDEFEKQKKGLWNQIGRNAAELDYLLQITPTGIAPIPMKEGKPLTTENRENLEVEEKRKYEENGVKVRHLIEGYLYRLREYEKEFHQHVQELNRYSAKFSIKSILSEFEQKYQQSERFLQFVDQVMEDILTQLPVLLSKPDQWSALLRKYQVNLFVDHSKTAGAPVRVEINPSFSSLFGKTEFLSKNGYLYTDHSLMKAGALHQCNGGYLVLDARDVVSNFYVWDTLKKSLYAEKIAVENEDTRYGFSALATMKPQEIPLSFKCILIGEPELYDALYELDRDFGKLFRYKVEFDDEMDDTPDNRDRYTCYLSRVVEEKGMLPISESGTREILRYSMRIAGSRRKLSSEFSRIIDLMIESDHLGRKNRDKEITGATVLEVIRRKEERSGIENQKIDEMIRDNVIQIRTVGKLIGQVNALTVLELPDYSFGIPTRVTATYALGSGTIIDIHREIDMSGKIFKKAVLTLESYIEATFSQKFPLSVKGTLAFEQTYGSIEGDSATMAETVALLSVLAKTPIYQGIAITGSMSQLGEAQAVGGINEKVEGFYRICKMKGLTGHQGVILPRANLDSLVLCDEVLRAIEKNKFHIWCVDTLEEVIEIALKTEVGKRTRGGNYPKGTLYAKIMDNLYNAYNRYNQGEELVKSKRRSTDKELETVLDTEIPKANETGYLRKLIK
jgi:lon-related putative ATP-dependent protease